MNKTTLTQKSFSKPYVQDVLLCAILTTVFAAAVFFNLGDTSFPQTEYTAENKLVTIDFGHEVDLKKVVFVYGGEYVGKNECGFRLYSVSDKYGSLIQRDDDNNARFHWFVYPFNAVTRYALLDLRPGVSILEMGFFDNNGLVEPVDYSKGASFLFDEQGLVPNDSTFINGCIYDELFYAATAYEFIHGFEPFEWTHPPLGKSIIALGISLFGMTPFGWRFMSALFGILMLIPVYALSRRLFGSQWFAFFTAFAFAFDFMSFVHARIANLDIFLVAFIIFSFLFMSEYIREKPENRLSPKSLACLGLSGVFVGLAISIKWSGLFAGLGLFVLFALALYDSWVHYSDRKGLFAKYISKTALWCVLFFIIVPAAIYLISYIPLANNTGLRWPHDIITLQSEMFNVQRNFTNKSSFQSSWWTWPLNLHPVICCRDFLEGKGYLSVHMFGNPALWWGGLLALIWSAKRWMADKDSTARFLCVAWIALFLPWAFTSRTSYIYYYFPCVPFLALMIAYFVKTRKKRYQMQYALGFCILVFALFALFYPVLSGGFAVSEDYLTGLEWLSGWNFIGTAQ